MWKQEIQIYEHYLERMSWNPTKICKKKTLYKFMVGLRAKQMEVDNKTCMEVYGISEFLNPEFLRNPFCYMWCLKKIRILMFFIESSCPSELFQQTVQ